MVADTIETSAHLLKNANEIEEVNKSLTKKLKKEKDKYTREIEKLRSEGKAALDKLRDSIRTDDEK